VQPLYELNLESILVQQTMETQQLITIIAGVTVVTGLMALAILCPLCAKVKDRKRLFKINEDLLPAVHDSDAI
jgi:hypothetical protein